MKRISGKPLYWILGPDGRTPEATDDIMLWGRGMEDKVKSGWRVGWDYDNDKGVTVSTTFLGIDHGFGFGDGPPVLFETMIFGGPHNDYQERYCSWAEAELGHALACELAGLKRLLEAPANDQ
jgi:hypothetical protein